MTRAEDTRRQCHSKGWTRRGHEKTVPFEEVDNNNFEEKTREDSAIRRGGR